ncbi:MAG: hypothetical protein U0361_19100 [Nitrospiraceae bacterium]
MNSERAMFGNTIVPLDAARRLLADWHGEQTYHRQRLSVGRVLQAFAQQQKGGRRWLRRFSKGQNCLHRRHCGWAL